MRELVLRYRAGETGDGCAGGEGIFTICACWLVSALTGIGETDRARARCEKLLSYASPLPLYAEATGPARPGVRAGTQPGSAGRASAHLLFLLFRGRATGVSLIRGRAAGPGFPAHAGKNRHCAGGSREHGDGGHLEPARAP